MNRFCSSKIGLEQSHTECIFSQALFFFAMLFSPLVLCCFLPSVAFCAGQSRGILWDSSTTYKCGLKAAHPDKNRSQSRLSAVLKSADWVQQTRSKDRQHHRTGQVHKEMAAEILVHGPFWKRHNLIHAFLLDMLCKYMFSSCGLLLALTQSGWFLSHWELWWNMILWEPWLTALFLRSVQEVLNKIKVRPKDWEK